MTIAVLLLHIAAYFTPKVEIPRLEASTAKKLTPVVLVNIIGLVFNTLCLRDVEASFFQVRIVHFDCRMYRNAYLRTDCTWYGAATHDHCLVIQHQIMADHTSDWCGFVSHCGLPGWRSPSISVFALFHYLTVFLGSHRAIATFALLWASFVAVHRVPLCAHQVVPPTLWRQHNSTRVLDQPGIRPFPDPVRLV